MELPSNLSFYAGIPLSYVKDFKAGKTMYLERITGALEDMQTGNVVRVLITGIHIHEMDILVAQIDLNNGIDITLSGTATDLDFVEKFPDFMA